MTDTITVVGNIANNPEHRTAGAVPVTSFRVATSERRLDAQGVWVDAHTNWFTVSAFRTLAVNAFASLRRGDRVIVTGRLRVKEWTAADGTKGRSVEIDADALGHDLRFGTAVYQRGARGESPAIETTTSEEWSSSTADWAAPETDAPTADGTDAVGVDDTDGAHDGLRPLALSGAATPF